MSLWKSFKRAIVQDAPEPVERPRRLIVFVGTSGDQTFIVTGPSFAVVGELVDLGMKNRISIIHERRWTEVAADMLLNPQARSVIDPAAQCGAQEMP